jgi:hypothetical protein
VILKKNKPYFCSINMNPTFGDPRRHGPGGSQNNTKSVCELSLHQQPVDTHSFWCRAAATAAATAAAAAAATAAATTARVGATLDPASYSAALSSALNAKLSPH